MKRRQAHAGDIREVLYAQGPRGGTYDICGKVSLLIMNKRLGRSPYLLPNIQACVLRFPHRSHGAKPLHLKDRRAGDNLELSCFSRITLY